MDLTLRSVGDMRCFSSCRPAVDFAKRDHLGAFGEIRYQGKQRCDVWAAMCLSRSSRLSHSSVQTKRRGGEQPPGISPFGGARSNQISPNHSASLGGSINLSTLIRFSTHARVKIVRTSTQVDIRTITRTFPLYEFVVFGSLGSTDCRRYVR